ncbi:hypothetical protein [Solidesulfovibrio alcoholivorans]|uniref:hypothetical protein n=1 Tax=Solidesulfovibrio alcoholivorans TaxID=81406 RepID=UPI0012EB333A|nr:hypothetical protein [Solidesulfovibrio alcoholivorans]
MSIFDFFDHCKEIIDDCIDWFDSPSDSKGSIQVDRSTKISANKGVRTRRRKAVIVELLRRHTLNAYTKIESIIQNDEQELGKIQITSSADNVYCIQFCAARNAIGLLEAMLNESNELDPILEMSCPVDKKPNSHDIIIKLGSLDIGKILKKADQDFGPMAGMDVDDKYIEDDDPFMQRLRRV